MRSFVAALSLLCADATVLRLPTPHQIPLAARDHHRTTSIMMLARRKPPPLPAKYVPEGRDTSSRGCPESVFQMANFATGGARTPDTVKEIEILWKAFRTCFANDALAIQAAEKNSAVFTPQVSSPTKIKGSYALLVKRLGKQQTAELLQKNPGVLCNSPKALSTCTDKQILDAAESVAWVDANRSLVSAVGTVAIFAVVALLVLRIAAANPSGTIAGYN